ncbi:MAG: methyltransferase domain-containing protein [Nitrospirales bacterium]|nr:MAG: methyltransferase domain-containing protein [Nitrospirales bacterium]
MAEHLPFPDGTFDFVLMGYALRHVSDLQHTFNEYWRVLQPGERIVILEISRPNSPVSLQLSRLYLKCVVPGFSYLRTHNPHIRTLMRYFWDTIQFCVSPETILQTLRNSGFVHCREHALVGGLIRDYTGQKP